MRSMLCIKCTFIYIYKQSCTYIYIYICVKRLNGFARAYAKAFANVYVYLFVYAHSMYMCMCMCVCMYACLHVCVHTHVYIYIYLSIMYGCVYISKSKCSKLMSVNICFPLHQSSRIIQILFVENLENIISNWDLDTTCQPGLGLFHA